MLAQLPVSLDLQHWQTWAAPLVGLASAGLMLVAARIVFRRRQGVPPIIKQGPATVQDPFELGSNTERRSSVRRIGKTIKVLISDATAQATPFQGWVCDRSMGGLCLAVPRQVETNMILSVRTVDADPGTPWVQVEVKRCSPRDGRWELGCQFVRTPPYSQLLLFG
jgi:PilZ domain